MSRIDPGPDPGAGGPADEPPEGPPRGTIRPSAPGPLAFALALGVLVGWSIRPLTLRMGTTEPEVTALSVGLVWFIAALVAGVAYTTWRARREGVRLAPHRAVNRLVLGKTCALVGALVAGGYFGFALAHVGGGVDRNSAQLWHSVIAGFGGLVLAAAALLLEQACRVRSDDD